MTRASDPRILEAPRRVDPELVAALERIARIFKRVDEKQAKQPRRDS